MYGNGFGMAILMKEKSILKERYPVLQLILKAIQALLNVSFEELVGIMVLNSVALPFGGKSPLASARANKASGCREPSNIAFCRK